MGGATSALCTPVPSPVPPPPPTPYPQSPHAVFLEGQSRSQSHRYKGKRALGTIEGMKY